MSFHREDALALTAIEGGSEPWTWERPETARFAVLTPPRDAVCPQCDGSGRFDRWVRQKSGLPCGCCKGKGRATVKELRDHAAFLEMMARGGYVIDGDSWEERCAGIADAKRFTDAADALEASLAARASR